MIWVIVFGSIGLAGAIMLICYAVWLAHTGERSLQRTRDAGVRADELAELVGRSIFQNGLSSPIGTVIAPSSTKLISIFRRRRMTPKHRSLRGVQGSSPG